MLMFCLNKLLHRGKISVYQIIVEMKDSMTPRKPEKIKLLVVDVTVPRDISAASGAWVHSRRKCPRKFHLN